MKLSQFKFKLPEDKIALHPTKYRDESRLMVLHRRTGEIEHKMFKDILNYFDDKDVFIFNDTKVFPARLYGNKEKTGARIEVFLLRELNEELRLWDVLVDPACKLHTHSKTPTSFPGLVEFFLQLLLPQRCLVYVRNLENTVSLLLDFFPALFLVWFLKIPAPFGFHLLKPFMVHTFRPLLFLEYFFRASVLHGIEIVKGLFRGPVIPCALVK